MTPAIPDDEDRPKKKIVHEIGQELALLSVKELQERIALLKDEIARLDAAITGLNSGACTVPNTVIRSVAASRPEAQVKVSSVVPW